MNTIQLPEQTTLKEALEIAKSEFGNAKCIIHTYSNHYHGNSGHTIIHCDRPIPGYAYTHWHEFPEDRGIISAKIICDPEPEILEKYWNAN